MLIGVSASAYAVSLAGVTALQSSTDARIAAEPAPAGHAADVLARDHDALEASLNGAAQAYTLAADRYAAIGPRLTDMETSLADLSKRVSKVTGAANALPGHVNLPTISTSTRVITGPRPRSSTRPRERPADRQRPRADGQRRVVRACPDRTDTVIRGARDGVAAAPDGVRAGVRACRIGHRTLEVAWSAVRAEFEAVETEMSRFRDSSDLMRLNRVAGTGRAATIPRRLERALVAADRAHRVTDGRFDPRMLRDLERLGYPGAPLDATDATGAAAPLGDRIAARMRAGQWTVERPIDLGGIGKGLALRWAAALLERHGVERFLLEAGGDLVAHGPEPEEARGWSGSRTRPVGRMRSRSSPSSTGLSPPRRCGCARGTGTAAPSIT